MDTIKNPQRQMQRLIQPGQFLKVTQHQHTHWIPPRHPLHKPASAAKSSVFFNCPLETSLFHILHLLADLLHLGLRLDDRLRDACVVGF